MPFFFSCQRIRRGSALPDAVGYHPSHISRDALRVSRNGVILCTGQGGFKVHGPSIRRNWDRATDVFVSKQPRRPSANQAVSVYKEESIRIPTLASGAHQATHWADISGLSESGTWAGFG